MYSLVIALTAFSLMGEHHKAFILGEGMSLEECHVEFMGISPTLQDWADSSIAEDHIMEVKVACVHEVNMLTVRKPAQDDMAQELMWADDPHAVGGY